MATNWAELARSKVRPQVEASVQDTPLKLLQELGQAGVTLEVEGQGLKAVGILTPEQRERIQRHKRHLLVLLSPRPTVDPPIDWYREWELERDMLRRRMAASWDLRMTRKLEALAMVQPIAEPEWKTLAARIFALESELRQKGELPPCPAPP